MRQRRADVPAGLKGVAQAYHDRYGLPMVVTETSIEGRSIGREVWLDQLLDDAAELRAGGVPLVGLVWWPLIDHLDWDAAMTHRVGKIHEVGLVKLVRLADGTLRRLDTPLLGKFRDLAAAGDDRVGPLEFVAQPAEPDDPQLPPLFESGSAAPSFTFGSRDASRVEATAPVDPAPGLAATSAAAPAAQMDSVPVTNADIATAPATSVAAAASDDVSHDPSHHPATAADTKFGIVVFSHLRWGFVWQRPQQFLSRFARRHPVLFVEEPLFDAPEGYEPRLELHRVMPGVTVAVVHAPPSWTTDPRLPGILRLMTQNAIAELNGSPTSSSKRSEVEAASNTTSGDKSEVSCEGTSGETSGGASGGGDTSGGGGGGAFDRPLLWYYSPMDAGWSLGHFPNRGVVYDCMDELSQFTGAPPQLTAAEARLMDHADVVFCGGYNLGEKKAQQHPNVHTFGCGVEFSHFGLAQDRSLPVPADVDFMSRPILGFFGVVDERIDYVLLGELARRRPDWSICVVGPVVKVDPAHLPHAPNLYWLGGRDYSVLPDYCRAFDVCLMPFAMNRATEFINPTKGLEYMATGRPIVSTPVRDVVRQWSEIVHVADNRVEPFAAAVDQALAEGPDAPRVQRGLELAAAMSWEATVDRMQQLINLATAAAERRSAQPVAPVADADALYTYARTPGS